MGPTCLIRSKTAEFQWLRRMASVFQSVLDMKIRSELELREGAGGTADNRCLEKVQDNERRSSVIRTVTIMSNALRYRHRTERRYGIRNISCPTHLADEAGDVAYEVGRLLLYTCYREGGFRRLKLQQDRFVAGSIATRDGYCKGLRTCVPSQLT